MMTKKELVKIIQEAVKREVQKEVKKIFINEGTQPQRKSKKEKKQSKKQKTLKKQQQQKLTIYIYLYKMFLNMFVFLNM